MLMQSVLQFFYHTIFGHHTEALGVLDHIIEDVGIDHHGVNFINDLQIILQIGSGRCPMGHQFLGRSKEFLQVGL